MPFLPNDRFWKYNNHKLSFFLSSPALEGRDDVGVVVVGGGVSGVCAGVRLGQIGVRYVILEKADGIGGAWRSNRYPGSGPDVASHLFAFSFYLNPRYVPHML